MLLLPLLWGQLVSLRAPLLLPCLPKSSFSLEPTEQACGDVCQEGDGTTGGGKGLDTWTEGRSGGEEVWLVECLSAAVNVAGQYDVNLVCRQCGAGL